MKKVIKALLISLLLFLAFSISAFAYEIAVIDERGTEYYQTDYKFYLPSHISPSKTAFKIGEGYEYKYVDSDGNEHSIENGKPIDITPYKSALYSEDVYVLNVTINGRSSYLIIRYASSLPSAYITLPQDVGAFLRLNLSSANTGAVFYNNDGTAEYVDLDGLCEFKVRGNATKDYKKKPFQIKLPNKANLYGMGSAKTWILLANYDDQSLIRNNIMYKIGEKLGLVTCDFRSIDLFINGEYHGIYLLCEKVQIGKNRLEITNLEDKNDELNSSYNYYATHIYDSELISNTNLAQYSYVEGVVSPSDITGGYLIELDNNYYKDELCYFTTDYGNHYVIKSPEYASKSEVEYIAKLFADMEEAIMADDGYDRNGVHYKEYIDIDSFASAYIMQEFGRNFDAGSSSLYFYKDVDFNGERSKIYKGPLWDCDNTLGNIHKNGASNPEGFWAKDRSIWSGLTKKQEFNSLVSQKFSDIYDYIFDMIDGGGFIDNEVQLIGDSIYMEQKIYNTNNYSKWPLYYDGTHYDRWQSSQVFNFCGVYSQGNNKDSSTVIGYLCEHIEGRANWLAREWGCDVTIRERQLSNEIAPTPPTQEPPTNTDNEAEQTPKQRTILQKIFYFIIDLIKKLFSKENRQIACFSFCLYYE